MLKFFVKILILCELNFMFNTFLKLLYFRVFPVRAGFRAEFQIRAGFRVQIKFFSGSKFSGSPGPFPSPVSDYSHVIL